MHQTVVENSKIGCYVLLRIISTLLLFVIVIVLLIFHGL